MPEWFKDFPSLTFSLCLILLFTLLWSGLTPTINQWHYQVLRWYYEHQQSKIISEMTLAETEHFIYAYEQLSSESLVLIQEESEHIFQSVNDFFDYSPAAKIPVMIFPSGEALNERFGWEGDRSPMGVYWMGYINILAPEGWIDGSTGARAQIFRRMGPMAHEYTHLIIDEKTHGNYPRWFSEGVAQYVEQSLGYFTTTLPQPENRRFLPFSQLERRFDEAPLQNQAYWQSLEAIHYLTEHFGQNIIAQMLTHLNQGSDFQTALQLTTGLDEAALLNALTAYYAAQAA